MSLGSVQDNDLLSLSFTSMAALGSISLLSIKSISISSSSSLSSSSSSSSSSNSRTAKPLQLAPRSSGVVCEIESPGKASFRESKTWRAVVSTALAAAVVSFGSSLPANADLNKYEAETRGEFGIGSAAQFGSADLRKAVHVNENFRRANFTAADMRESDFSGSTFNGAYLEKAVAYKANFTGADLSDTLMDRMVKIKGSTSSLKLSVNNY
ncbi:hypothetical protein EUGRSUZ_D02028 [Eucalyptus grandis]|uniref:Uncharacterized protein n=2 Tax=Eucalyptus grandis TaxID=71139 RepID=A0ACC3L736_EUCGR|nr:hypothetical protein EUGRSUZ_D02028 [Eucalyptus grandis]